jgi:hypothetical protein
VALRAEKWKLCRRECVEYIYPFPDALIAGFAFWGSYSFTYIAEQKIVKALKR